MFARTHTRCRLAAAALCLACVAPSGAAEIEGVRFADRVVRDRRTLLLNNVGLLRYRIFFKGYVAALYLGEGVSPDNVLENVPKRLELEYFWPIAGPEFGKAADRYLALNVPAGELPKLRERLNKLHSLYRDVKPGDRYALTYLPGRGLELSLNDVPLGTIGGDDFASAYFSIWLGPHPIDVSLKTQLLRPVTASR